MPGKWITLLAAGMLLAAAPAHATRPADVPARGAQPSAAPIPSDRADALPEPSRWTCAIIRPEYREWIRTGHKSYDWKYVGKLYRSTTTGEYYSWNDWLAWSRQARCGAGGQTAADREGTGLVIWLVGIALLPFSFGGSSADSPG